MKETKGHQNLVLSCDVIFVGKFHLRNTFLFKNPKIRASAQSGIFSIV